MWPSIMRLSLLCLCLLTAGCAKASCDPSAKIPGAGARYVLMAEGDSITFGVGSTDGLGSYVQRACVPKLSGIETNVAAVSQAILGSPGDPPDFNSLYGRMAADNAWLAAHKDGRLAILSVLIGRNDLVGYGGGTDGYADALAGYVARMRRAGWDRIIVATVLPSTWDPFDTLRDDLNSILGMPSWMKANGVDALADFARSPEMGPDGAASDKALYADGIHPTSRGYELLAPVYDEALRAVILRGR